MKVLVSVLTVVTCLLLAPTAALAENYVVNDIGDEADVAVGSGGCDADAGAPVKCTLRAAIQESNSSTSVDDTITFAALFNGEAADTISAGAGFPAITDKVTIDGDAGGVGGQCTTAAAGAKGPCAGVARTVAGSVLVVENADGVTVEGLALTNATGPGAAAINVLNSSASFVARDNWLGVKLDGSADANERGIFLDPDSNGATIGGTAAADRNVIANSSFEGLDIEGADNADVLGNYFGVKPDGSTQAANNKNIEITDTVAFEATGNEIGATVVSGAAPCDGGCNVISGSTTGIDLSGNGPGQNEEPATGPTTVHGNFIGLNAAGTGTVANNTGVYVGKAEDALIGGPANADANFIAGGAEGIAGENGEGFAAIGNIIGAGAPAATIAAPAKGVFLINTNNTNPVEVSGNVFDMDGGVAVQIHFGGTEVTDNFIEGAELGVWTKVGPNAAGGNLIEDNVIGESLANGIRIEDKENEVLGNAVYKAAGPGILLELPVALLFPTENLIGGNAATDENNINESGGPAIKIVDESGNTEEDSLNEVGRNRGAKNAGRFIDLVGAANAGILPPTFATSQQSGASGSAEPGARVRVFRKKAAEVGELESFLAEATADGSGKWKVTYPAAIPVGTLVAATQTSPEGATSELEVATTSADPSAGSGAGAGGADDGKKKDTPKGKAKGKGKDRTAPETTIVKKKVKGRTVKFAFVSSEAGSAFQCKLDKKPFKPCRSPKKYKRLKPGKHVFQVRAIDAAGNRDKTPAMGRFRVRPRH